MDFSLTEQHKALRERIVRFAQAELNDKVAARDREQAFRRDLWLKCGELKLQGLPVPEEYGGAGLDSLSTAVALEGLGYGCTDGGLVFSVGAHLLPCVVPIWKLGTAEQKNRLLPQLCNGTMIGAHAMSEPNSGSDAFSMTTKAEPDGSAFRLNGKKMFVSNGPVADLVLVFALTDAQKGYHGGVTAFLVDPKLPGVCLSSPMETMGLRTTPLCSMTLENVRLPAEAVLGGVGGASSVFTVAMDWERTLLFASHVGTMERLLEKSVNHARTRKQFGQAVGKFQAISGKIADMKVRLEAARLLVYQAAWRLNKSKMVSLDASIAKLFVSESYRRIAEDAVQIHGGYGYLSENEFERVLRDSVSCTLYSGTSEMQRSIIGRWLGL